MMINCLRLAAAAALMMVGGFALAQDADAPADRGALEVRTVVEKLSETTDENGQRSSELVPLETAVPGDEVVYTVTFTNVGTERAENIRITNPIPEQMRYVSGTAFGPGSEVEYSVDGGSTYAPPQLLRVVDVAGSERPAEVDDYTHIRWALNVPLEAGEQSFARFRAVVR